MIDDTADTTPGLGAPIMPTGSGIADLEIAREQDAMAAANVDPEAAMPSDEAGAVEFGSDDDLEPTIEGDAAQDSRAHPS